MLKEYINSIVLFFKNEIWNVEEEKLPVFKKIPLNILKVLVITIKNFGKDNTPIYASALTYFSMLSIVPVIAVGFAIAKGFGLESILEEEIAKSLAGQEEVAAYLLSFAKSMLSNTKGGILAIVSIAVLLYTVLKLFHQIEISFNTIWKIEKQRSFIRKFTDYLAIVMIAPILIVLSGTLNVYVTTILRDFGQHSGYSQYISPFIFLIIKFVPYILIWLLFTLLYLIIPNKSVKFIHAMTAGIIAGTAYQLLQYFYITLQIGFSRYNAIYGSFAALPLFLIWLQMSWNVVLAGAQISASFENLKSYGYKNTYPFLSQTDKRRLSLMILKKIVDRFKLGLTAPNIEELSEESQIPILYVTKIVDELCKVDLVSKVVKESGEEAYQPATDINKLSFALVIDRLTDYGETKLLKATQDKDFEKINQLLNDFNKNIKEVFSDTLIKDL
ncbi:MAG: YihY/virulence factor BrkB family protein [Bacteroidales bacterium]|nr:YihY/virulence factor BrkB family protein [Bacteroidales bacterium]